MPDKFKIDAFLLLIDVSKDRSEKQSIENQLEISRNILKSMKGRVQICTVTDYNFNFWSIFFAENFDFKPKFNRPLVWAKFVHLIFASRFLPKFCLFVQNFNFCPKLLFLSKISIFVQNFNFCPKFQFLSKISIFVQNFNFCPKFLFFVQNFYFLSKIFIFV